MQFPMTMLPMIVNWLLRASVSLGRIEKFLTATELDPLDEKHDQSIWLKVNNADFSWNDDAEPTLRNINLEVTRGELVAIVGSVGSGKSSMMQAILGSMKKQKGTQAVSGSFAYVPQEAWIRNATVRANVLFGTPFNSELYKRILYLTGMDKDMEQFQFGDQTVIGEKVIFIISFNLIIYIRVSHYLAVKNNVCQSHVPFTQHIISYNQQSISSMTHCLRWMLMLPSMYSTV